MSHRMTRRAFLRTAAGAGAAVTIAPAFAAKTYTANERINIAFVGVGGMGGGNLGHIAGLKTAKGTPMVDVVGLCDVDRSRLASAKAKHGKAKDYVDFRKMLTAQRKEIDAVMISTPDHTHYPAAMMAIKMGKAV